MHKRMTRRSLAGVVAVFLLLVVFPTILLATHSWGGYHWARTSNPFNIKLGDNVAPAWDQYLNNSSVDWSLSSVLDTSVVTGGANPKNCRPTNGRVEVCNSTYGNTGWLGVAQIWITGGSHIYQGTVKVNDTYFNTSTYNTYAWREMVMCQEIGHTFGLNHQDENFNNPNLGTCMDYTNNPSRNDGAGDNTRPNQHDYDELAIIYQHLDSTTTISAATAGSKAPPAMNDIDLSGPEQWGKVVSGSRAAGHSVHELDFGNGNKVITFVLWARDNGNPNH